jgi:hypothetical protein
VERKVNLEEGEREKRSMEKRERSAGRERDIKPGRII